MTRDVMTDAHVRVNGQRDYRRRESLSNTWLRTSVDASMRAPSMLSDVPAALSLPTVCGGRNPLTVHAAMLCPCLPIPSPCLACLVSTSQASARTSSKGDSAACLLLWRWQTSQSRAYDAPWDVFSLGPEESRSAGARQCRALAGVAQVNWPSTRMQALVAAGGSCKGCGVPRHTRRLRWTPRRLVPAAGMLRCRSG
jgi:hypothetical protein